MKKLLVVVLFFGSVAFIYAQKYTVKGVVKDAYSQDLIPFAMIKVGAVSTQSDVNGKYSIKITSGIYTVESASFGYKKYLASITVSADMTYDILLATTVVELEKVELRAERSTENVDKIEMGTEELKIEEIKKIPAFMGEVDIIKTITLLPGVTTVGEGASGFNVRGGGIDQNLILMDEATIYSSSHLFGFFSVFNADAVDELKLYKGSIPARYGGRLSSVLDVKQREGDYKKFHGQGGIGLVSSRLTLEGPIKKDTASFIISARRTYADQFLRFFKTDALKKTKAYFHDFNTKLAYRLGSKDKITVSAYYGRDFFNFGGLFGFDFGNGNVVGAWSHRFKDSSFVKTHIAYNNYNYKFDFANFFEWTSVIKDYQVRTEFTNIINNHHKIRYGGDVTYYRFKPAKVESKGEIADVFKSFSLDKESSVVASAFISDEMTVNNKLSISYGLRYSGLAVLGGLNSVQYKEGLPLEEENATGTKKYKSGEVVKYYHGLMPRFGIRYKIDSMSSIKGGYNRMRQNLHLVSNTTNSLPLDVWKMSDEYIKPATADQVSVGYFRNVMKDKVELSAEVYYKQMHNLLDYKNGADLLLNQTIETELLQGKGRAYGLEIMIRKKKGKFTGWLAYTLSRTERKIEGKFPQETINFGKWYKSNYDKPHDISFVGTYDITKRLNVGLSFLYSTGRPISFPDGRYTISSADGGTTIPNYLSRNNGRISSYHRLDLSATLEGKHKKGRQWEGSWTFSIYNLYGRKNAYSWSFSQDDDNPDKLKVEQLSILGTILPAVTYNFKF